MYVGRFQPFHKGHLMVVNEALMYCDHLILVIGSAQESGTKKNPFDFETRKEFIRRALRGLGKRVTIIGINDRAEVKDDQGWGEYLLNEVERQTGKRPVLNVEGEEPVRSHWFDSVKIGKLIISRKMFPCSATQVREAILKDDFYEFTKTAPTGLWIKYPLMRKILLEVESNERKVSG
jgi:nicotinamide-nucleotide adenylyltransferase